MMMSLANALSVLAVIAGLLLLFVAARRRKAIEAGPWNALYLISSDRARAFHPTTLFVEGILMLCAGVAAFIWLQ
jgi:hypothetical protein